MDDRVFIIGSTGFIGSQVCRTLEDSIPLSRKDLDLLEAKSFPYLLKESDTIIYAAGIPRSKTNNEDAKLKNISMVKNLLKMIGEVNLKRFIFLSSVEVYGNSSELPITEETKENPLNLYAEGKLEIEELLKEQLSNLLILRLPGIFGNKSSGGLISLIIDRILNKKELTLFNEGKTLRDFVYVGDLADYIKKMVSMKGEYKLINFVKGHSLSLLELYQKIEEVYGKGELRFEPNSDEFDLVFDNDLLKNYHGNEIFTEFNSALEAMRKQA